MKKRYQKLFALAVIVFITGPLSLVSADVSIPNGLGVVGLTENGWKLYIGLDRQWTSVDAIKEPRTLALHSDTQRIAFIGPDSRLQEYNGRTGSITQLRVLDDTDRFTQPHYSADGKWLTVVQMPSGKSRRTSIIGFDRETGEQHAFVRKRTAQFEPFLFEDRYLYYSTAICVDDCDGMIWELWRRDLYTGKQVQLTLTNSIANQPHMSRNGWLYFTSNADNGLFHIWRMRPEVGAPVEQITSGNVRDSDPVTDIDGTLYFLRKTRKDVHLIAWQEGVESVLPTPGLIDLRNLEMGQ